MKHFSKSQPINSSENVNNASEIVNKHEQKQTNPQYHKPIKRLKRTRVKVKIKEGIPITSSDKHRAFIMNVMRIQYLENNVEKKTPYYIIFGQEKFINEDEVELFKAHGVTIYYK